MSSLGGELGSKAGGKIRPSSHQDDIGRCLCRADEVDEGLNFVMGESWRRRKTAVVVEAQEVASLCSLSRAVGCRWSGQGRSRSEAIRERDRDPNNQLGEEKCDGTPYSERDYD